MYEPDFSGCIVKIQRAYYHIQSLEHYFVDEFSIPENSPRVGIKFKTETGEHVVYISYMPDYENSLRFFSVVIGDVVHNLRSSLDHLVFQLALQNTNGNIKNEKRVQFPIEDVTTSFQDNCIKKGGSISEVHPSHQAIIERFQPYHRSKDGISLAVLREFSNMDKHRLLPQVLIPGNFIHGGTDQAGEIIRACIQRDGVETFPQVRFIEHGTELYSAIMSGWSETNVDMAGYILPAIEFQDIRLKGNRIGFVLNSLFNAVVVVLNKFTESNIELRS